VWFAKESCVSKLVSNEKFIGSQNFSFKGLKCHERHCTIELGY
jgi:hypothetical protein